MGASARYGPWCADGPRLNHPSDAIHPEPDLSSNNFNTNPCLIRPLLSATHAKDCEVVELNTLKQYALGLN